MYYLFHGKMRQQIADKAYSIVRGLLVKKPDASYVKLDGENWTSGILAELSGTQGLFESKHVVFCDNLWSDELPDEEDIRTIQESENIFILVEDGLKAENFKLLSRYATKVTEIKAPKEEIRFNVFSLSDALGEKDKKKLWVLYRQALSENIEPEDVHGILLWQIKNLILAKRNLLNGKLKLSPFVASKAKRYSALWSEEELLKYVIKMAGMYHEARLGLVDVETSLEKMILEI